MLFFTWMYNLLYNYKFKEKEKFIKTDISRKKTAWIHYTMMYTSYSIIMDWLVHECIGCGTSLSLMRGGAELIINSIIPGRAREQPRQYGTISTFLVFFVPHLLFNHHGIRMQGSLVSIYLFWIHLENNMPNTILLPLRFWSIFQNGRILNNIIK